MSNAEKLYKKFHGRKSKEEYEIDLGDLKELTFLGYVSQLNYIAKKIHIDPKVVEYFHKFEKTAKLFTNGKILIIHSKHIKIDERGIHG